MRFLIKFSYDGSKYNGYQKQPRKRTIQKELEKALREINGNKKVLISASGRTDKGVHAINQYAHFDLNININPSNLKRALNSLIPDDIYIKEAQEVDAKFHARFDVKKKEYIYKINMGEYNPMEKDYIYQYCKELDVNKMTEAMSFIRGTHNFKSFVKGDDYEDYERTIFDAQITKNKKILTVHLSGTGFMRYMVRNIVGLLIDIGEHKYESTDIIKIIDACDRKKSGKCAPACGLYLKDVYY